MNGDGISAPGVEDLKQGGGRGGLKMGGVLLEWSGVGCVNGIACDACCPCWHIYSRMFCLGGFILKTGLHGREVRERKG